jgi:hypothetical protein
MIIINFIYLEQKSSSAESLKRFLPISENTSCIFAKKSKLWGYDWSPNRTLEENARDAAKLLEKFLDFGKGLHLDGFLFEIDGTEYCSDINSFGQTVRRVLTAIAAVDPTGQNAMKRTISKN